MRGRPRLPTALHEVRGNPGRRPLPAEPDIPAHDGACPAEIAGDDIARAFWERHVPTLIAAGYFKATDEPKFVLICVAWAEFWANRAALARGDRIQHSGSNGLVAAAENGLARGWMHELSAMLAEYGFSPSARAKLGGGRSVAGDPLAEHLAKRPKAPRAATA